MFLGLSVPPPGGLTVEKNVNAVGCQVCIEHPQ